MMPGVLSSGIPQYGFVKSIVHLRNFDLDRERGLKSVVKPAERPAILDEASSSMMSLLDAASSDGQAVGPVMDEPPPAAQAFLDKANSELPTVDIVA